MCLNAQRFPRASKFVKQLPSGLSSYPECQIRADVFEHIKGAFPELGAADDLPEVLKSCLSAEYRGDWMPEAVGNTIFFMLRDANFNSDMAYLAWQRQDAARLYDRPLYRVLMHVFSPALIVMGAGQRWSTFHRGTELKVGRAKKRDGRFEAEGRLIYPAHLFGGLLLQQLNVHFLLALETNGAKEPRVRSEENGATEAVFRASWTT